jgi:hypothetical protein
MSPVIILFFVNYGLRGEDMKEAQAKARRQM